MNTDRYERRANSVEIRAKGRRLEGYAAVFGHRTKIADFEEIIARGAFNRSITDGTDILALVDHDATKILARTANETLRLEEDSRGLQFEINLPKTTLGNDIAELVGSRTIRGMSFGFVPVGEQWSGSLRTLHSVDLREISIVSAHPAYPQTSVHVRASRALAKTMEERMLDLLLLEQGTDHAA